MKNQKFDLYQTITNTIINALESGTNPWKKPWDSKGLNHPLPINFSSKKAYRGINIPLLWASQMKQGFNTDCWVSYKQALSLGGQVQKGEKSTMVVFWSFVEKEEDKKIPFLRYYNVFNLDQIDGIDIPALRGFTPNTFEALSHVDDLIIKHNVDLRHGGDRAYCSRVTGHIQMPEREQFHTQGDYYATLLHELTHWSGHPNRLDRTFGDRFGDQAYAFEELIAEIGSAILCADLGIKGDVSNHASYIESWLRVLKNDKKAVFTASSQAQKAHQYLMGITQTEEEASKVVA